MSDPNQDPVQTAWRHHAGAIEPRRSGATMEECVREQRRRTRRFLASASIIVPSWIAMFWLMPDLRPLAAVGLAVASILMWRMLRATPAVNDATELPCAAHEIRVLTRERDFYRSMPRWIILPLLVSQIAIVATLLLNPRFEKSGLFTGSLTLFICTVIGVLAMVFRRSRRILAGIERELSVLAEGVEA